MNNASEEEKPVTSYSCQINSEQLTQLKIYLIEQNFIFKEAPYTFFVASHKEKALNISAYEKGKLLIQGKGTAEFISFYLEPTLLKEVRFGYEDMLDTPTLISKIGVDESGKGDYFGPLVIAGVYLPKETIADFRKMGVKDSKQLSDKKIITLARKISSTVKTTKVVIMPERYNVLYAKINNLNKLLAWGHARVIENLLETTTCTNVLTDKFAHESLLEKALLEKGQKATIQQNTKAESDMAVAAASIIAKAEFINRLNELSIKHKTTLLKGAGAQVDQLGKELVAKHGKEILNVLAKVHFGTTHKILGTHPELF